MRKIFITLASVCVLGLLASNPAHPQLPPPGTPPIRVGTTPVQNGTSGRCLYDNAGKVGEQACGGVATDVTVGTTTVSSGTNGREDQRRLAALEHALALSEKAQVENKP